MPRTAVHTHTSRVSGPLDVYLHSIDCYPLLTRSAEHALAHTIQADGIDSRPARDTLVCHNLRLVVSIARAFTGRGLQLDDLIGAGNLGLIRAATDFDPAAHGNTRFSTYATPWVKQAIRHEVEMTASLVRVPCYLRTLNGTIRAGRVDEGELPAGKRSHLASARLILAARPGFDGNGDGDYAARMLPDRHDFDPIDAVIDAEERGELARRLAGLTQRERAIVVRRLGLGGCPGETLQEIGATLGLTRERVRQIEGKAMAKLGCERVKIRHARRAGMKAKASAEIGSA